MKAKTIEREYESPNRRERRLYSQVVEIVNRTEKSLTDELAQILQAHWLFCTSSTPIEHVYALDASKLFAPDITVFGARIDEELVGVGAMRKTRCRSC
jgi:hypothetical protein